MNNTNYTRKKLIADAISQIEDDIKNKDVTAIEELLKNAPLETLANFTLNPEKYELSGYFAKTGDKLGHELNLLYQKGQYLTSKGWKSNEALGKMIFDLIKEVD